ncbi:ABC transporter substrate-binding protein [Streptomyces sp. CA-111067]|uniref:ABC transporter substrate-binding protein n=1 Tax=Streptomyces sp. CA-111067 TaxID=3240046 RepID=UPI003D95A89B
MNTTRTRTRSHRRGIALAAALAAVTVGAAACSSGTSTSGSGSGGGSGSLTVAGPYQITGLDPSGTLAADNGTQLAAKQIFSTLVIRDGTNYTPGLATSWKRTDGDRTWTFQLRPSATFSDGTPVTSDDVKQSVAREVKLAGPLAALWTGVTVSTPGKNTVAFTAKDPQGALLSKLGTLSVLPAASVGRSGFFNKPVGSGPFEVSSFTPGQKLTLVPNPRFYGTKPSVKKVTITYISNISARVTALKTGEIQGTWGLPDDQIAQLDGQDGLTTKTVPSDAQYTLWFNSGRPAFQQTAVRRALWQAVDYSAIIKSLYPVTGTAAKAPISTTITGFAAQAPYAYDPAAAKAALTSAGFDFGKSYQLAYSGDEFTPFAQAVASDFAKIGVKVVPTEKEKATYLSDLLAMKWDINLQSLSDATGDADYVLGRLYTCKAARTGYCKHTLDQQLAQAAATGDQTTRDQLYAQAQKTIWDQAVGMYPMDVRISYTWRDNVSGFATSTNYQPSFAGVKVS